MFGKDLVVVTDLDETKSIEEMEFAFIPIWVRVLKLPFGMMNKAMGEAIGGEIGSFVGMELEEDETAVGRYLRIKVRIDIRKPLMRGVTVLVGEEGKEKPLWCPLEYEYLPDFCYTCGIIGHTDKTCEIKLKPGEVQQFNSKLRCVMNRRRGEEGGDRYGGSKYQSHWRSSSGGSGGFSRDSGGRSFSGRGGSDAPSWRKDVETRRDVGGKDMSKGDEQEVTSPLKEREQVSRETIPRKVLFAKENDAVKEGEERAEPVQKEAAHTDIVQVQERDVHSAMQAMHVDGALVVNENNGSVEAGVKERGGRRGTYRKIAREKVGKEVGDMSPKLGKRRAGREDVQDVSGEKKLKSTTTFEKAGLSGQPCEDQ